MKEAKDVKADFEEIEKYCRKFKLGAVVQIDAPESIHNNKIGTVVKRNVSTAIIETQFAYITAPYDKIKIVA